MPRKPEYHTKTQSQLLGVLQENAGRHFTAMELNTALAGSGKPVGLATIYRQLEKLEAQGLVRRYTTDDRGSACWQYAGEGACCHSHFHLKCTACGQLFHLECSHIAEIYSHVAAEHSFQIDPGRTVFYGICGECRHKQEGAE